MLGGTLNPKVGGSSPPRPTLKAPPRRGSFVGRTRLISEHGPARSRVGIDLVSGRCRRGDQVGACRPLPPPTCRWLRRCYPRGTMRRHPSWGRRAVVLVVVVQALALPAGASANYGGNSYGNEEITIIVVAIMAAV